MFHSGEEAVQRRAGVFEQASRLGSQMIVPVIDGDFARFLASEPVVFIASSTPEAVWVSVLWGPPGFAAARSPEQIVVRAAVDPADPLTQALRYPPAAVGVLVLEPMTRGRIRLNGLARVSDSGLEIELREVFGNCPKYIQRRRPVAMADPPPPGAAARASAGLDADQCALVAAADTCFLGSRHPDRGADASHRGGRPGFVSVAADGTRLTLPDYRGNNMFQTLGNLTVDSAIGMLFVDWRSGRTLQLTGHAEIVWDGERLAAWPKALRLIEIEIVRVIDRSAGLPLVWELVEAHRLNPELPRDAAQAGS